MDKTKKWKILSEAPKTDSPTFTKDLLRIILHNRGFNEPAQSAAFLNPKLEDVTLDAVGIDQKQVIKAIDRIKKAQSEKEQVIIFGDYDVDGITGSAVLWETFHELGLRVMPFIPHRIEEGYGLSIKGIEHVLERFPDTTLIITVDNGIVADEAVSFAREKGIDVIVTDHHTVGKTLPAAYAIVHTTALCGAGVGWLLCRELAKSFQSPRDETTHLDLVALATVADLVSLTGANRTLVRFGLEALRKTNRPGILALCAEAKINPENITVYDIGHIIAPRLNAMGRLESAMDSLRLLCTKDKVRAESLSEKLGVTNKQRQIMTVRMSEHAKGLVLTRPEMKKILIVSDQSYEQGVIGLIAGRLVEIFYRPVIVLSVGEKISKASARSVAGFNIIEFIRTHSAFLLEHGGHPMAAGFSIETEKLNAFQKALESLADDQISDDMLTKTLTIDCILPIDRVDKELFDSLSELEPFGMQNTQPTFVSEDVLVRDMRILGADGRHIKFRVGNGVMLDAIGFNMGEWGGKIQVGDKIAIAYTIDENTWNGKTNLQLKIKDIKKT